MRMIPFEYKNGGAEVIGVAEVTGVVEIIRILEISCCTERHSVYYKCLWVLDVLLSKMSYECIPNYRQTRGVNQWFFFRRYIGYVKPESHLFSLSKTTLPGLRYSKVFSFENRSTSACLPVSKSIHRLNVPNPWAPQTLRFYSWLSPIPMCQRDPCGMCPPNSRLQPPEVLEETRMDCKHSNAFQHSDLCGVQWSFFQN